MVLYLILFVLFWNYWYFKTHLVRCPSYTFVAYCYRNHKFKIKLIKELYYHKRTVDKIWYNFVIKKWQKLCNLFVDTLFSMLTENVLVCVAIWLLCFFVCFEKHKTLYLIQFLTLRLKVFKTINTYNIKLWKFVL